jgi:hypothetical protein
MSYCTTLESLISIFVGVRTVIVVKYSKAGAHTSVPEGAVLTSGAASGLYESVVS